MSWNPVGLFRVTTLPIYTPVVSGRLFRVRSLDRQRFQITVKQVQVILDQVETWQAQRLAMGPEFLVVILEQPGFFEQRRLSMQLADFAGSSEPKNILIEVNPSYE